MIKPKGSVTITHAEMIDIDNEWALLALFKERGVPICGHAVLAPHPNYVYTESVDYARHSITITWSNKL